MRNLEKHEEPQILSDNHLQWLAEYLADPNNNTKKFRYRHADIKQALRRETAEKCIYCESKIGHNTPGDIEHKIPTSQVPDLHFAWENITIACGECNRRKNDFYNPNQPFIDPYSDDVEALLVHQGPVVTADPASPKAEIAVRVLELMSSNRASLIARKIEKIDSAMTALTNYKSDDNELLKLVRERALREMMSKSAEYSAMVKTLLEKHGFA